MKTEIVLNQSSYRHWEQHDNSWSIGEAFCEDELMTGSQLVDYLIQSLSGNNVDDDIAKLNGFFSAVISVNNKTFLVSDKIRSIPLLYCQTNNAIIVSDSAQEIIGHMSLAKLDADNLPYYLACGHLYGNVTILDDCHTLPPASIASIDGERVEVRTYFSRRFEKHNFDDNDATEYVEILRRMAFRLKQIVGDRQIVIPLSGGYDSRLVVCLCKMAGVTNVLCYSYGIKGSYETAIAERVAQKLEFEIQIIEYTSDKWDVVFSNGVAQKYLQYGGNLNSISHMFDLAVLYELHNEGLIHPDAIFLPGHSGDLLAGMDFVDNASPDNIVDKIYNRYFVVNVLSHRNAKKVKQQINAQITNQSVLTSREDCYEAIYQWNINSRQPYYIVNWNRVFEFFGHSWYMPLWDDEYVAFWTRIVCCERRDNDTYYQYLFDTVFRPMGVDFRKPQTQKSALKSLIADMPFAPKYRIKCLLSKLGIYHFPVDNSLLNEVAVHVGKLGLSDKVALLPCSENSMSAKTRYYIYYIDNLLSTK